MTALRSRIRIPLAAIALAILATGGPADAAPAHLSTVRLVAPFTGFQAYGGPSNLSFGCGANASYTPTNATGFNLTTGHYRQWENVSAVPVASCALAYPAPSEWLFNDIELASSNITVATGGLYVLRTYWWWEWRLNYTTHVASNRSLQSAGVSVQVDAYLGVFDLSTNLSVAGSTQVYSGRLSSPPGNGTGSLKENTWISLPIVAPLTHRQVYQLYTLVSLFLYASAGSAPGNAASGSLDIGTMGRGMVLQAVTVK